MDGSHRPHERGALPEDGEGGPRVPARVPAHVRKAVARYGEASGFLAIAFGVALYAYLFRIGTLVAGTAHANVYLAALALAVVVLLLGAVVLFPRMNKAMRILEGMAQPGPPPAELARLMRRLPLVGAAGTVLVFVILGLMIVGAAGAYV